MAFTIGLVMSLEKSLREMHCDKFNIARGLQQQIMIEFLRFWWETKSDGRNKWFNYSKGGPYNKWLEIIGL